MKLKRLSKVKKQQKFEYLYLTQRSFIYSFISLVNCHNDGTLKQKNIVDYWKKPEYVYLGPDENMHNKMIEWLANYSKISGYKLELLLFRVNPLMESTTKSMVSPHLA